MTEYQAKIWHDYSNTTTPITANDLNKFEDGIETAINGVNELSARVQALESSGTGSSCSFSDTNIISTINAGAAAINSNTNTAAASINSNIDNNKDEILNKLGGDANTTVAYMISSNAASINSNIDNNKDEILNKLGGDANTTVAYMISSNAASINQNTASNASNIRNDISAQTDALELYINNKTLTINDNTDTRFNSVVAYSNEILEAIVNEHDFFRQLINSSKNDILRAFRSLSDEIAVSFKATAGKAARGSNGTYVESFSDHVQSILEEE